MKIVSYIVIGLSLVLIVGYCTVMEGLKSTTWGGWEPPSTELALSDKEQQWKNDVEKKYSVWISSISLDDAFRQDSILYMNIELNLNSPLQQQLYDSTTSVMEISRSFMNVISSERQQKLIELSFRHLLFDREGELLKSPTKKTFLFNAAQNSVEQESDN